MSKKHCWTLVGVLVIICGCGSIGTHRTNSSPSGDGRTPVDTPYDFGGFSQPGNWYKGNLHLHSTISDGELDPPATVEVYRKAGYDFVALTDHIGGFKDEYTNTFKPLVYPLESMNTRRFLVVPGMEYDTKRNGETIHFVVVGPGYDRHLEAGEDLSSATRKWWDAGAFVFLAHPHWSLNGTPVAEDLTFLPALEVFNYAVAHGEGLRGNSQLHWDRLLCKSRPVLGVATDDSHHPGDDSCGGWVMVKAGALTGRAIVKALRDGRFYFSSGPTLHDVFFDRAGKLHVRCSPVTIIRAVSTVGKVTQIKAKPGRRLRKAIIDWDWEHWNKTKAPFVRVECVDKHGRTAWTQAVLCP